MESSLATSEELVDLLEVSKEIESSEMEDAADFYVTCVNTMCIRKYEFKVYEYFMKLGILKKCVKCGKSEEICKNENKCELMNLVNKESNFIELIKIDTFLENNLRLKEYSYDIESGELTNYKDSLNVDDEKTIVMFKFVYKSGGRFTLLCRPNSTRVSLCINAHFRDQVEVEEYIYGIYLMINDFFETEVNNFLELGSLRPILINGNLKVEPGSIKNSINCFNKIYNFSMEFFECIKPPEFLPGKHRKGCIKFFVNQNRKHGSVTINKHSFQFLGFTNFDVMFRSVKYIKTIVRYFNSSVSESC